MRRLFGLASIVVLLLAFGCGNSTDNAGDAGKKDGPKITVGSSNFPEALILGEIYAQGLEAKGYTVGKKLNIGAREAYFPAILKGSIDFLPEYTGSTLNYLTKQTDASKPDPQANYDALVAELKKRNITALEMSSAQDQDGTVTNKVTADKYSLKKVSDLKPHATELVMGGPPECKTRIACLKGLEDVYGIHFKEFKSLDASGTPAFQLLAANQIQVANLYTTDARIADKGLILLQDDKGIVGAENIVPVVRNEITDAYGSEFEDAVNAITAQITTKNITELNKRVVVDKEDPDAVAADWLQKQGLL